MIAFCWKSGEIEFCRTKSELPQGAIAFAKGPEKQLRAAVDVAARHAYDGKTLLVPGLPEIKLTKKDPVDVLEQFTDWVNLRLERKRKGVAA